jgi:hypothetical protein
MKNIALGQETEVIAEITGKHAGTIYNDLYTAFSVPRYQDIPESVWEQVERWFKLQIERGKKKP